MIIERLLRPLPSGEAAATHAERMITADHLRPGGDDRLCQWQQRQGVAVGILSALGR